jgi:wyosine [tRNA(Phe)-imidazoG37] synthetase (radical SAM superfamily)
MSALLPAHLDHTRRFAGLRHVYPVLSRRARGISLGVNLNPDTACTFDCVYCQVDRHGTPERRPRADIDAIRGELLALLDHHASGALFEVPPFDGIPQTLRRLSDIALAGDGEPTACLDFPEVAAMVADVHSRRHLGDVKLVLMTSACLLHRPDVRRGLDAMRHHGLEVWGKLDAGTEDEYRRINRSPVPFRRILENLGEAARRDSLVIQSMFFAEEGRPPAESAVVAWVSRLKELEADGGRLREVQIYTVARPPADPRVGPLPAAELEKIAEAARAWVVAPVAVFPGPAG